MLTSLSIHLLASLNMWVTVQLEKALIKFQQSFKRGSNMKLREERLVSKCTRTSSSSSILMLRISD